MMDYGDDVPAGLMEVTAESLAESLVLQKRWQGAAGGRIHYAFAPRFAVSCTEAMLRGVVEAANELGSIIHTHAAETAFENEFCAEHYDCTNMEFLERIGMLRDRSVLAHGVHVTDDECGTLARTKTAIAHCPSSNLKLASGIANIPRYDEYGVRVSLGADGPPCNNNLDAFIEMRLAALLQKPIHGPTAMPARRVVQLATIDGARALGIGDETGSLEVGKSADLVVLDMRDDPGAGPGGDVYSRIVYSARRSNVRHVFSCGRHVVQNRELVGVDLGALMARGRHALHQVQQRM
jgi:5-methylthioadenosine/S-adenosylhomocysteine deaminase